MALREILANFGFTHDARQLHEIDKSVEHTKGEVEKTAEFFKSTAEVFLGVEFARQVKEFVVGTAEAADAVDKLSIATGLSRENVQLFSFGAELGGVRAEEFAGSLLKLSVALGHAGEGSKEQSKAFADLGIQTANADGSSRSLNDVLPEIFENFSNLRDDAKQSAVSVALFSRAGTRLLPFLKDGKEGLAKLRGEFDEFGGGFSDQTIESSVELNDNITRLQFAVRSFKNALAITLFPILSRVVIQFAHWTGYLNTAVAKTNLLKGLLVTLGVAGVAALTSILAPFAPAIAALTLISGLVDDFITYLEGGDSVIGAILKAIGGDALSNKVRGVLLDIQGQVKAFFIDLFQYPKKFHDDLLMLFDDLSSGKFVKNLFGGFGKDESQQAIADVNAAGASGTAEAPPATFWENLKKRASDSLSSGRVTGDAFFGADGPSFGQSNTKPILSDLFDRLLESHAAFAGAAQQAAPATGVLPAPQQVQNTIQQTNKVNITIAPGTPDEQGEAVRKGAENALKSERRAALDSLEQRR